ncbi:holotricin-3-like isoform X1 [Eriocheir sinensis]|uniref:holotricin-3-like isoform X1 n=1 Tax=Eriocheir sinensis TaxID=95602 RepID=UPI0021C978CE|nr:holotricin-3-like isoform X1 [Eriocheir sinensis]
MVCFLHFVAEGGGGYIKPEVVSHGNIPPLALGGEGPYNLLTDPTILFPHLLRILFLLRCFLENMKSLLVLAATITLLIAFVDGRGGGHGGGHGGGRGGRGGRGGGHGGGYGHGHGFGGGLGHSSFGGEGLGYSGFRYGGLGYGGGGLGHIGRGGSPFGRGHVNLFFR